MRIFARAVFVIGLISLVYGCTLNRSNQSLVFPPTLSPGPIQYTPPVVSGLPTPGKTVTPTPPQAATIQPVDGAPRRIDFTAGETFSETTGNIRKGELISFLVSAQEDQWLMVDVGSRNLDVHLGIKGVFDHTVLVPELSQLTTWQGLVPATQDYEITLNAGGEDSNYNLGITIPEIIKFAPGAISAAIQGSVAAHQNVHYILYALAGQTMSVKIHSIDNDVLLTLYGIDDGQPLARAAAGATEWNGILSRSQYFMIIVVSSGNSSQFLLDITIQ